MSDIDFSPTGPQRVKFQGVRDIVLLQGDGTEVAVTLEEIAAGKAEVTATPASSVGVYAGRLTVTADPEDIRGIGLALADADRLVQDGEKSDLRLFRLFEDEDGLLCRQENMALKGIRRGPDTGDAQWVTLNFHDLVAKVWED